MRGGARANHPRMATDVTQFTELLRRNAKLIHRIAYAYFRDPADREDAVQEIAVQLWRSRDRYDERFKETTWVYRIALNVAISHVRQQAQRRGVVEPLAEDHAAVPGDTGPDHETNESQRVLERLIAALEPLDRALLLLYLDERPQREIAEVLGISPTNVATKIGRLKQRLRQQLDGDAPSDGETHGTR